MDCSGKHKGDKQADRDTQQGRHKLTPAGKTLGVRIMEAGLLRYTCNHAPMQAAPNQMTMCAGHPYLREDSTHTHGCPLVSTGKWESGSFFFSELEFELMALWLTGKGSTT